MTYRGRSDGLVVESDRKKIITFKFTSSFTRLARILRLYIRSFFFFFLGSASPQSPLLTSPPCVSVSVSVCLALHCLPFFMHLSFPLLLHLICEHQSQNVCVCGCVSVCPHVTELSLLGIVRCGDVVPSLCGASACH